MYVCNVCVCVRTHAGMYLSLYQLRLLCGIDDRIIWFTYEEEVEGNSRGLFKGKS
jgi:hypothetical protein